MTEYERPKIDNLKQWLYINRALSLIILFAEISYAISSMISEFSDPYSFWPYVIIQIFIIIIVQIFLLALFLSFTWTTYKEGRRIMPLIFSVVNLLISSLPFRLLYLILRDLNPLY